MAYSLIVPFGRGEMVTVLDVTMQTSFHLYTIYNNHIKNKDGNEPSKCLSEYEYIDDTYSLAETEEGKTALDVFKRRR